MANPQPVYLDELAREWNGLYLLIECKNPFLRKIFEKEKERAGLGHLCIQLLTPEEPDRFPYDPQDPISHSEKMEEGSYIITVTVSPRGLKDHLTEFYGFYSQTWNDTIRLERYGKPGFGQLDIFQDCVRRELAYIGYGVRDIQYSFAKFVKWLKSS